MNIAIFAGICFLLAVLWDYLKEQPAQKETTNQPVTKQTQLDDSVTLEDMILHDMNNDNDVYDIGAIDFND